MEDLNIDHNNEKQSYYISDVELPPTIYSEVWLDLSPGQRGKLLKALADEKSVTLCIKHKAIGTGDYKLIVNPYMMKKLRKVYDKGLGCKLKFTISLLRRNRSRGCLEQLNSVEEKRPTLISSGKAIYQDLFKTQMDIQPHNKLKARELAGRSGIRKILETDLTKKDFIGLKFISKFTSDSDFEEIIRSLRMFLAEYPMFDEPPRIITFYDDNKIVLY
jgi:hypothetical protein